ncbi:MAG: SusC/RagA family TonB-linked outer membrane protein [Bacteroidaceae bacterium]|nr:SusC/RagA family TonB-linked outer membrane protein [Bacteroidaceae bacterium]
MKGIFSLSPQLGGVRGGLLLLFFLFTLAARAQDMTWGVVKDKSSGETLIGVNVSLWQDGAMVRGTTTDGDGRYKLETPAEDNFQLRLSYIGYKQVILRRKDIKPGQTVRMEEDSKEMGQVVVNGYFAKNKTSYTGAVQQITGDELRMVSATNIMTAIASLTPGMEKMVDNAAGSNPNHVPELVLRGMSSFSNDGQQVNQPTIILDGREISMQDLYDLDINEVDNINVLKDAAATALYGAKAANGVIVITRKPVMEGAPRVQYNLTGNVQFPVLSDYHLLSAADKLEYERLAGLYTAASGAMDAETGLPMQYTLDQLYNERYQTIRRGQNTDWLSQPVRTAFTHDHSIRVYGGSGRIRYELTGRYGSTKGVMRDDYRTRYGIGFNLDYTISDRLRISNRLTYSEVSAKDSPYGSFAQYALMNPYDAIYKADGSLNNDLAWDLANPLYEASLGSYDKNGTTALANSTDFRWQIARDWRLTGQLDLRSNTGWSESFKSPQSNEFKYETDLTQKGYRAQSNLRGSSIGAKIMGAYNHIFADNSLVSVNAGWEINHSKSKNERTMFYGFFNDQLSSLDYAASTKATKPSGGESETADVGFFVNGAGTWRNRYLLDFTWRMTGSSQFGANERFGHFWAAGAGWNINKEPFMQSVADKIDILKLRGSVGYTGKVSFSPFQAVTMYEYKSDYEYRNGIGAVPKTIGNTDLRWERTMSWDGGIDVSLFDRRVNFVFDIYLKQTKDLLLDKSKAPSTGVTSAKENIGELQNWGFEYQLDFYPIRTRDLYWKVGVMGYINRNKITKMSNALKELNERNRENQSSYLRPLAQYAEGESLTALKLVRSAGIDPATGREIYIKRDGSLTFTYDVSDKVYIGDTQPAFTGAVSTNLFWKGFSLYALFNVRYGAWMYNLTRVTKVEGSNPKQNADQRVFDSRWKQPGDVTMYKNIADSSRPQQTDRFAEQENTLTLQTLNLSYQFGENICKRIHVRNLRVGINFTDLFRISTVKTERGTDYPYSQGFEFNLGVTL